METLKFKTNINCGGCVAKVSQTLKDAKGVEHWEVDTVNPHKILTVRGLTTTTEVMQAVQKAGFKIEIIG